MTDSPWQDQLIDEWRFAYNHANGKSAPRMSYHKGWFYIHDEDGRRQMKPYRMAEVIQMRDRLRAISIGQGNG